MTRIWVCTTNKENSDAIVGRLQEQFPGLEFKAYIPAFAFFELKATPITDKPPDLVVAQIGLPLSDVLGKLLDILLDEWEISVIAMSATESGLNVLDDRPKIADRVIGSIFDLTPLISSIRSILGPR